MFEQYLLRLKTHIDPTLYDDTYEELTNPKEEINYQDDQPMLDTTEETYFEAEDVQPNTED